MAYDPTARYELFKSDGTAAGTYMVKDICPSGSSSPNNLTAVGSEVYFSANDGTHGVELWKSDGTSAGTVEVIDINPGLADSYPSALASVNGTLFFTATDGVHGFELWKSDGTSGGTTMVKDVEPGATDSIPSYLTNVDGTLFFAANDGTHGYELWKSDGTSGGTVMLKDIDPGSVGSMPDHLTAVGSTLFFTASDGTDGTQLWKSDGTAGGTVMVRNINPGGSSPTNLVNMNGMLYFAATTSTYGNELWQSDGTAVGTTQLADIYAGEPSSNPTNFVVVGSTLFFTATDALHPTRLWMGTFPGCSSLTDVRVDSTLSTSTYGQSVSFTVNVSGGGPTPTGTVQFLVDGADLGTDVTLAGGSATSPTTMLLGAGNHTVEADYSGDSNYSANTGTCTQGMSKAHLTVTADPQSKAYGAAVPALTYRISGFVNGDTSSTVGGTPGLSTSAASSSPVGAYPITVTAGTLSAANYDFPNLVNGTLTVNKSQLTVTADSKLKIYGAPLPALTATLSGFVNGDTSSVVSGAPALTTAATAASHVTGSSYPVFVSVGSLWAANYSFAFVNGALSLNPAPLSITANNAAMAQGTAVPPLSVSYGGFVNGDSAANLATQPTFATPASPQSPAGAYPILAGGASSPDFAIHYASGVLIISPAPVRILNVSIQAVRLGKTRKTTPVIVLQFSGSLNAADAQLLGNFSLTTIPTSKKQKSKAVALSQATYNPANNTVRLMTRKPLVLNPPLRLTANFLRLLDTLGDALGGNHEGQQGGILAATLSKKRVTMG
jgi:ELWxxDGT repeat protein